jgi:hypothetical protein
MVAVTAKAARIIERLRESDVLAILNRSGHPVKARDTWRAVR